MSAMARYTQDGYQVSLTEEGDKYTLDVTDMRWQQTVHTEVFDDEEEADCAYANWNSSELPTPVVFKGFTEDLPPFNDGETEMLLLLHKGWGEYAIGQFTRYDEDSEPWLVLSGRDAYKVQPKDYLWGYLPAPRQFIKEL